MLLHSSPDVIANGGFRLLNEMRLELREHDGGRLGSAHNLRPAVVAVT